MKDPCRICRACLVGNQCRWIFSPSTKNKLQVILSHVLRREVTRDGRGEFLCGKCVFQLEKIVKCDADIIHIQDDYNMRIKRLQAEKDHLIQCMMHVYKKNNPDMDKNDGESCSKSKLMSPSVSSSDNQIVGQQTTEGHCQDTGRTNPKSPMRRCVSLDRIAGKSIGHCGIKFGSEYQDPIRSDSVRGTRHRSQSMYFDLVHRKCPQSRYGFKGHFKSLQSLNRDFASDYMSTLRPKTVKGLNRLNSAVGSLEKSQTTVQSSTQPSIVSDVIQLLCYITTHQISVPAGSRIPILRRISITRLHPPSNCRHKDNKILHELAEEFDDQYTPVRMEVNELHRLKSLNQQLSEEVTQARNSNEILSKTLEDIKNETMILTQKLEEKENELNSEKKNALKRDKTIQGLTQILSEKENEIAELCHEIEDRDEALSKARETAHKAQLQKYQCNFQGAEEYQNLLMEKQTELAQLQGEHHTKVLETQKLQRALDRKELELAGLQQAKDQQEIELEDIQQQKKKGDKALNDLNNQLKKLNGDIKYRESALEQQYQEALNQTKQKVLAHEATIQRLTTSLMDKEQQLQEYINMLRDFEHSKSSEGIDGMLSMLRQRLKEKDKALEQALDEKFAAIEDKDNEIHMLQLSLREKERDLERLNNLVSHNEETINSLDTMIKEKDVELQHLANTLKNLQRSKQEIEDNLSRSLREKDAIISQLKLSLEGKTKHLEELTTSMLNQFQSHPKDLDQQMSQRLKVAEAMLAESVKIRERLIADNESAVEGLLVTINSKDQLLKESGEHYKYMMSQRTQEVDDLRKQLSDQQQHLNTVEKQCSARTQNALSEAAELRARLEEKDGLITKLLQQAKDRDQYSNEIRQKEESAHVLELRHTIQIMQEKLDEKEAELSTKTGENKDDNIPLPKKNILKKELLQTTEALNNALTREAELKLLLNDLEVCCESKTAKIEFLTATLQMNNETISTLRQRIGQKSECLEEDAHDQATDCGTERFLPKLPQRERTMIGGDNEQQTVPSFKALQQEHEALNRALKAEQQLYSSLVRTVKEQDSAQRLHALQLELTAVQLLRQQLEESIKTNDELRDDLEREMHRAKLREGMDLIDPKELESMRNQLEDAQRWNVSLQARLGAIQNRGGGVGGTNDGDSLTFLGDQTSYLSICVGEEQDDNLSQLTSQELREKVTELQDYISRQNALNRDLQNRLSLLEKSYLKSPDKDELKMGSQIFWKQQPLTHQDKESQTDATLEPNICGDFKSIVDETRGQTRSGCDTKDKDHCVDDITISNPFDKACSESCFKEKLVKTIQLKEKTSHESKEECVEASGECIDAVSQAHKTGEMPQPQKIVTSNGQTKSNKTGTQKAYTKELTAQSFTGNSKLKTGTKSSHTKASQSRLPVPVRRRYEATGGALEHQLLDVAHGSDQQILSSDSLSSQSCPSSLDALVSNSSFEVKQNSCSTLPDVPSATQLEILQQQCQDKEVLISELHEKLADLKELQTQLQEKERLNLQYTEALQAAESTIAYLTACSLDSQGALGSNLSGSNATLQNKCIELKHALNEKVEYICELTELLQEADTVSNSSKSNGPNHDITDLDIKAVLQRNACSKKQNQDDLSGSSNELPSNAQWDSNSAVLTKILQTADSVGRDGQNDSSNKTPSEQFEAIGSHMSDSQKRIVVVLMNCLNATKSAIASLTAHCTNSSSVTSTELQTCLDKLKKAFNEKETLGDITLLSIETSDAECSSSPQMKDQCPQGPHHNLQVLYEVFSSLQQKMLELQASQKSSDGQRPLQNTKALPPNVQNQIETLHKELREKRKICKNLEEKLATAQSKTPSPGATHNALKQDEKGVQVDLQDLGYETSAKSENDREESSSTDLEVGFKPICGAASLPSLLKQEQAIFSSTENLYSASSTYPTSPVLSSAKASIKSLRRSSLSSDVVASTYEPSAIREEDHAQPHDEEMDNRAMHLRGTALKDKTNCLNVSSERRASLSLSDLLHSRSGSTSPARLESLIQSQARELSQLRQEIKDSRRLGALQRQQLEDLGKAFSNLIQSAKLDNLMGEEVKKQLDRSIAIMDSLEGRLDRSQQRSEGESLLGSEHSAKVSHRLTKELQEKNRLIQNLQSQTTDQSPGSHHSSHSNLHHINKTCSSSHSSQESKPTQSRPLSAEGGGVLERGASDHGDTVSRLQGLHRENVRLQEQLRSSEQLNTTLRSELDLHCTIMAQSSSQGRGESGLEARLGADSSSPRDCPLTSDLLAEHLQEIRALRRHLEESIRNNDSLREQLEKKLAEAHQDSVRTHIFIKGREEHSQVTQERQYHAQQTSKKQLNYESEDKQKENDKLRETLARRAAKLEQSRKECEMLRQDNMQMQERLEFMSQENAQLKDSLLCSKEELLRLQHEVKVQGQQLVDSHHLLQSLRVELQVYDKLKSQGLKSTEDGQTAHGQEPVFSAGSVDLGELMSEIRSLRLQLEKSIQTNNALRQRLEEQINHGLNHSETININYMLSSPDEATRTQGLDNLNPAPHRRYARNIHAQKQQSVVDGGSLSSSSMDSTGAPSRLVPGHRMWANRNGRHILGLIEDYSALRKHISEGRKLSHSMDMQLQECILFFKEQCSDKFQEQKPLNSLCTNMGTLQHVLEEANRLLKLLWRVSLPVNATTGDMGHNQQDEQLKREISRLKNRVLQQEKMLSGAVKRLGTTNQLKEGMERVIIDQLSLTHGILKKARGNLEEIPVNGL
ncbi:CDK5 regulatory subunit-associated protein 2 isoform X3 [Boleophthalmus pectinirostris]|uniref:CDK5 regulatory subunit-associated protein 2 isoform X3 n=1 Tax=Boleophthalmus pectinirostris TaxID=150288 RepID=UPI002432BB42|nr:CDK5 regulatory subunit-associated protein 2 isoform X3 [Boleophthalmus pectinirostris]